MNAAGVDKVVHIVAVMRMNLHLPATIRPTGYRERGRKHLHLVRDDIVHPHMRIYLLPDLLNAGPGNPPDRIIKKHGLAVKSVGGKIQINLV